MNDQSGTTELPTQAGRQSSRRRFRNLRARLVLFCILLVAVAGAAGYWYVTKDIATTDDAYTDGHAITIAPQVAGVVTSLAVNDNQRVHTGDLLLQIDPASYQA